MRKDAVHGNLEGIRNSLIGELAALYDLEQEEDVFLTPTPAKQYLILCRGFQVIFYHYPGSEIF